MNYTLRIDSGRYKSYQIVNLRDNELIATAEWSNGYVKGEGKIKILILINPDKITFGKAYQMKPSIWLNFSWNNKYFIQADNRQGILYCQGYFKGLWILEIDKRKFSYQNSFGKKIIQDDQGHQVRFELKTIETSNNCPLHFIKIALLMFFSLNPIWDETPMF